MERLNEKRRTSLPYLFKTLLRPVFSADGRWSSVLADYTRVAADVVAMDSELPLKSRDAISTATGDIPKLGMKLSLTEKQMKEVDAMIAQQMPLARIIDAIFADTPRCIEGIWERIEDIFLSELSTGVGLSERNTGTGIRIDVGYYEENKFGVSTDWTGDAATPVDDIQAVFDKALGDQNTITDVYADDTALNRLYKSPQVRSQFAFNQGIAMTGTTTVPVLDFDKLAAVFRTKWDVNLHRVSRKVKTEINGVKQNHSPWKKGVLAFVCDDELGQLVWTPTAEATRPVNGVVYQTADEYILVKKFAQNEPLTEFTASQAMVVPIINNVDRIYTLDSKEVTG